MHIFTARCVRAIVFVGSGLVGVACSTAKLDDEGLVDEAMLTEDQGCTSPTLGRVVERGACVQSRSNHVWYQCVAGAWERGVQGESGPAGPCAGVFGLDGGAHATDGGDVPPPSSCNAVAHIGDSLSAYTQPGLEAAYARHGVARVTFSAYGGRAILQKLAADPETGRDAARRIAGTGFDGCWVVALGTNDTANISAGASYSRDEAIDRMMTAIDPSRAARVMWVDTFTTKSSGHWASANMTKWNDALSRAKARWPNLRVFEWSAIAARGEAPLSDGIHYTTSGYAVRNEAIASALSATFDATR